MIEAMQQAGLSPALDPVGAPRLVATFTPNDPAAYGFLASLLLSLALLGLLFLRKCEAKRAQDAVLAQSARLEALGRLTGGVAHDFNNLLMVIQGNVTALRGKVAEPVAEPHLEAIRGASDQAIALVGQLLTFARGEESRVSRLDLDTVVDKSLAAVRELVGPGVVVERQRATTRAQVCIDPIQLQAALLNLATNARDAMPSGGVLEFATRAYRNVVELRISDTGDGMPPEIQARAFEPFFTTKAEGKGAGLGLAQVHRLAREAGGSAVIESAAGLGTVVTLRLPLAPAGDDFQTTKLRRKPGDQGVNKASGEADAPWRSN